MYAFGSHYKEKNLFQAYYLQMVRAIEEDDRLGFEQLRDELLEMEMGMEKYTYIWSHIDSSYRAKVKGWGNGSAKTND